MAIRNNIAESASEYGIEFQNSYYRIVSASVSRQRGDDPKFAVTIDLSAYGTSSPTDDTKEIQFRRYPLIPLEEINASSGDQFLDRCYSWVMTQDDMAGSTAV